MGPRRYPKSDLATERLHGLALCKYLQVFRESGLDPAKAKVLMLVPRVGQLLTFELDLLAVPVGYLCLRDTPNLRRCA